jgi:hypothetical protein
LQVKNSFLPRSPDTAMTVFCSCEDEPRIHAKIAVVSGTTHLQELKLKDMLSCELKPTPEEIEAVPEKGPYCAQPTERQRRSNLVFFAWLGKTVEQDEKHDTGNRYRQLQRGVSRCQGLEKR